MNCPLCQEGKLVEVKAGISWKCDNCGARLLMNPAEESAEAIWRDEQAYKYLISKRGGGGGASGNRMKRKKKVKHTPKYFLE